MLGDRGTVLPVIGLAHGSRHPRVTGALSDLMNAVAGPGLAGHAAFLDLTEPDLTTLARDLAGQGVTEAVVVPLLFTAAFHATTDVPAAVAEATAASGVRLHRAEILGTGADVRAVLHAHLDAAGIAAGRPVLLFAVGSSDTSANRAVAELAAKLGAERSAPAAACFGTTDPRAGEVLATLPGEPVVLPLFVSPGLLLDAVAREVAARGLPVLDPLGARLAPLVRARHAAALGSLSEPAASPPAGGVVGGSG